MNTNAPDPSVHTLFCLSELPLWLWAVSSVAPALTYCSHYTMNHILYCRESCAQILPVLTCLKAATVHFGVLLRHLTNMYKKPDMRENWRFYCGDLDILHYLSIWQLMLRKSRNNIVKSWIKTKALNIFTFHRSDNNVFLILIYFHNAAQLFVDVLLNWCLGSCYGLVSDHIQNVREVMLLRER